jgi:outer membrane receptor protein involved in Fe transport
MFQKKLLHFSLSLLSINLYAQDLISLKLEDLTQISLSSNSATLSQTALRDTPASVTVITHEDIVESGARNLDELLEIYVPSFTYMYKIQGNQIGMRGIISDRNNKILLLVNGKNMNIKAADGGAATEQWFSTLGDIKKVTVISGSGSTIYGPGAIAGIISIETFDGNSFDGVEVSGRMGVEERFYTAEMSVADQISSGLSYYIYYGVDSYDGASQEDAPEKFAFDFDFANKKSPDIYQDQPIGFPTTSNNGSLNAKPRHKFHAQLTGENFNVWLRFTKSSSELSTNQNTIIRYADFGRADWLEETGYENQQLTLAGNYRQKLNEKMSLDYSLSYMLSDVNIIYSQNDEKTRNKHWGENNFNAKVMFNYAHSYKHTLNLGIEYDYNHFGRKSYLNSSEPSLIAGLVKTPATSWRSTMYSFFGEYKSQIAKNTLLFVNMRADKHTYTEWMFSPRISLVQHLNQNNTLKAIVSRSVRHSDDADLYSQYLSNGSLENTEKLTSFELIYDYTQRDLSLSITPYYNIHDIVAFNDSTFKTESIGKAKYYGFEAQLQYTFKENLFISLSHAYNKLINFNLYDEDIKRQNISAQPYGYGNDFANWNNNITKLRVNYQINKKLKWINSMQIFWGIPGAKDMSEYNDIELVQTYIIDESVKYKLPVLESDKAVEESIYLNTGITYQASKQTLVTLNAYNLMGFFNSRYNKRNYFQRTSHYREMTPSFSCRVSYKF